MKDLLPSSVEFQSRNYFVFHPVSLILYQNKIYFVFYLVSFILNPKKVLHP